ncbi:MAG: hypothetical protein ACFFER_14105 [Candidatus Thorarchaeota archaeon]
MNQTRFTLLDVTKIAVFAALYTLFGLLIPIQGYVSVGFAIGTGITAVLYGGTLYYLNTNIPLGKAARFLITWLAVYVIQMLMPVLEGAFFTTQFVGAPELMFGALVFGWILVLPTALVGTLLFKPAGPIRNFREMRQEYFGRTSASQFAGRYVISSTLWMVIYFVFGAIISPFVLPYYTEGGVGYELVLPELHVVLALQLVRGFILVLMIMPLIISVNLDWRHLAVILAALLYIGGALAIFLISDQYPVLLRTFHGMEMFADAASAGVVIAYILGRRERV